MEWSTRKTMAEELYDYTSPASARCEGAFLVEQQNVVTDSACSQIRDALRAKMDQVLANRSIPKPAPEVMTRPKGKGGTKVG